MTSKPLILAVETASRTGSVAIAVGEKMLAETTFSAPLRHSVEILPAVGNLLARFGQEPWQIRHVYVSIGPGSFTGLRIATTLAKIIHLANLPRQTKIVPVDTLDVIAANAADCERPLERIATILDAKRNQFFIAAYDHLHDSSRTTQARSSEQRYAVTGIWQKIFPDSVMTAPHFIEKFAGRDKPIWLLGDGLLYYRDKFEAEGICFLDESYWSPRASKVHLLGWEMALAGQFADPVTLTPNYIRRPDVKIKPR